MKAETMNTSTRGLTRRTLGAAAASLVAVAALTACASTPGSGSSTESAGGTSPLKRGVAIDAPSDPGSGYDQTARGVADSLTAEKLSGRATVSNSPGAGGTVALASFVNKTDPNDLMVGGLSLVGAVITNSADNKLSDLTPIARLIGEYEVIVVPADSKYTDLKGYLEGLKADPGAHPIAIGNQGGIDHMWGGTLVQQVGVDPTDVNFVTFDGGAEVTTALLGDKVSAGISGYNEFAQQIDAGKLRVLAVSSEKPIDIAPNAPTVAAQGYPDAVMFNWRGIFAPPGISAADKASLSDTFKTLKDSASWKALLKKNGWSDEFLDADAFATELKKQESDTQTILTDLGLK